MAICARVHENRHGFERTGCGGCECGAIVRAELEATETNNQQQGEE